MVIAAANSETSPQSVTVPEPSPPYERQIAPMAAHFIIPFSYIKLVCQTKTRILCFNTSQGLNTGSRHPHQGLRGLAPHL